MKASVLKEVREEARRLMDLHYVSPTTGFLAENPPLEIWHAPFNDYFYRVNYLAEHLQEFIANHQVENEVAHWLDVDSAEMLDYEELSRENRHAFMLKMATIMHAWLREKYPYKNVSELMQDDEPKTLCPEIAIVMWNLSKVTGIAPGMSYTLYSLWNWRKKNPLKPLSLGNIDMIHSFTGTLDEKWFVWIHQIIDGKEVTCGIEAQLNAYILTKNYDPEPKYIIPLLETAALAENNAIGVLERMREHCDYMTYFDNVRPFYTLPKYIIFEGVEELGGKPLQIFGETGGQSPSRHFRLQVMGIQHSDDAYFPKMRQHMSREHRELVELVSDSKIREFMLAHKGNSALLRRHNSLIQSFVDWRVEHLFLVRDYIKTYGETYGTGKPQLGWLEKLIEETREYIIDYK